MCLFRGTAGQGHDILELVPKAVRSARLVERRAGPHPASQHLVEQPAVKHQVHAGIRRFHLHSVQEVIPSLLHLGQYLPGSTGGGVGGDEMADLFQAFRLAQDEDELRRLAGSQHGVRHHRRGRVEPGPTRPERPTHQCGGCGRGTIAAEEFSAICGHCLRRRAGGQECDLPGEAARPGVPGQDGTGFQVALADHLQRGVIADGAEHPLGIKSRRQAAGRSPLFRTVRHTSLTGSSGGTSTSTS